MAGLCLSCQAFLKTPSPYYKQEIWYQTCDDTKMSSKANLMSKPFVDYLGPICPCHSITSLLSHCAVHAGMPSSQSPLKFQPPNVKLLAKRWYILFSPQTVPLLLLSPNPSDCGSNLSVSLDPAPETACEYDGIGGLLVLMLPGGLL